MMKTPRHNGGAVHSRSMRKRTQTTVAAVVCKKGFYMSEYLYTEAQVREMWKRTYEEQIGVAQAKAIEAIVRTDGEVVVSLSRGKDSAVMLYIVAQMWSITKYKDTKKLVVMFANTSNEFNCMSKYTREFCAYIEKEFGIQIDFHEVRGDVHYFDVVEMVGFPFISKKVARQIRDVKATLKRLNLTYADIEQIMPETYTRKYMQECIDCADKLREMGFNDTVILNLTKITSKNDWCESYFLPVQWRPLIDSKFEFSEECCKILKKDPIKYASKEIGKLLPMVGEMAAESRDRMKAYMKTGCNLFDSKQGRNKSKPLGAATESTVLRFINEKNLPIAPVYGELIYDDESDTYHFTQESRTGCKLCGFGIAADPERYVRVQKYEPQTIKFAFTSRERGGLGYTEICTFLNEHCKTNIVIPEIEQGYYPKRLERIKNFEKKR